MILHDSGMPARACLRLCLALAMMAALAGCAIQPGSSASASGSLVSGGQGHALDDNLSGFLAQAPAGAVMSLAESPWGANADVIADEPYFAASGRECRQLQIISGGDSARQAVACETSNGWESRRLVTESTTTGRVR